MPHFTRDIISKLKQLVRSLKLLLNFALQCVTLFGMTVSYYIHILNFIILQHSIPQKRGKQNG